MMVEKQHPLNPLGASRLDRPSLPLEGFRRFIIKTSGEFGSDRIGSDRIGSDRIGSDRIGSIRVSLPRNP
ncbi:MAG: hypothetical protein LBD37_02400 [Treponema sp.]|nr:hypothetical protein [Treponema sp.]